MSRRLLPAAPDSLPWAQSEHIICHMNPYEIISTNEHNFLTCYYLESLFRPWFNVQLQRDELDESRKIMLLNDPWKVDEKLIRHLDRGGICILDYLWEIGPTDADIFLKYKNQILCLSSGETPTINELKNVIVPNWFWYSESLWYQSRGYDQYCPTMKSERKHSFLMPIRRQALIRDYIVSKLSPWLADATWSYVGKGRRLPDDLQDEDDQRYLNPTWYDETWYSLVIESIQDDSKPGFMTEKTCKPLAFYHPFQIIGQLGSLDRLRKRGFETFGEIFDESYDDTSNLENRIDIIIENIKNFDPRSLENKHVREKIRHNHDKFFNRDLMLVRIQEELLNPILNFLADK